MTLIKRLQKIETSLTPKQAVLLWLKEMLELGMVEYAEKAFKRPMHEAPRARLTEMVAKAVRESLYKQGVKWELTVNAAREAQIQTDFLIVLVKNLHREVHLECLLNAPYLVLLYEKFERMLEHFTQQKRLEPEMWELWRCILIRKFTAMWRLREVIVAISDRYFDHQTLLFPEDTSTLDEHIHGLEELMKHYNSLEGGLPAWTAIGFENLKSSMRQQILADVDEQVANAKATTLEDFGEGEAAWKLVEAYALAALERLRATSSTR